jgi:hypothetical protein
LGEANVLLLFSDEYILLLLVLREGESLFLKKMLDRPVKVGAPHQSSLLCFLFFILLA